MTRSIDRARRQDCLAQGSGTARAKVRVAQVIPSLQIGGLQKVVVRLIDRFQGRMDHLVLTPAGDGPLRPRFAPGVDVIALAERPGSPKLNALRMARIFRAWRPDIVHTRNWTCIDAVLGARLAGVPLVVHGEHGREAGDPEGRNRFRRRVRRALAPLITEFVAVSRDLARWLVEEVGVPAAKVTQIYNGVDTETFSTVGRDEARRALGIPDGTVVIGTVGRLDPVKDHTALLEAVHRMAPDRQVLLVIVGDGPRRSELEQIGRTLALDGRLRLLGERPDVAPILKSLDIFTLPSLGEGISNALLEAMASGLPVVATRVGGNPELVEDGVTGMLVSPRSAEALAAAFDRYLSEPGLIRLHGKAGRERVLRDFSLDRMFGAYEALYARLLAGAAA
ncbi:MAG TPA: glycosyltransferase [Methylomirabilota bacterium]|nr:glycosyltransferase [Methylomirabilota bacterium]